jgi:SPP1 gp7 family putative phage head morphogenesis protein
MFEFSEKSVTELLEDIFNGDIDKNNLPEELYCAIADKLKQGLYKGFGGSLEDFATGSKDLELLEALRDNVYMFSAAKNYQQVREMVDAITDDDGMVRPFKDFKEDASQIFETYNDNYLQTEYKTAIGQAQNAVKWNEIEKNKDVLPYLKYSAIEDDNTSEICAPLDGICLPVDDEFWDEFMPLNHFNCRCLVEQVAGDDATLSTADDKDEAMEKADGAGMTDMFKMNADKDGYIFKSDHPYFEVSKGDKDFAKNNFGMAIPDDD